MITATQTFLSASTAFSVLFLFPAFFFFGGGGFLIVSLVFGHTTVRDFLVSLENKGGTWRSPLLHQIGTNGGWFACMMRIGCGDRFHRGSAFRDLVFTKDDNT